jgi:hypothetical protein
MKIRDDREDPGDREEKFSGRRWPLVENEEDWEDAMMQECC